MKNTLLKMHYCIRLFLFLFVLLSLSAASFFPARAAENDTYSGICMDLSFSDSNSIDHGLEDYQSCTFLIQDENSFFLTTEYDSSTSAYHVTGNTSVKANATLFSCGMNAADPGRLYIDGLDIGNYTMTMIQTADAYILFHDQMVVEVTKDGALLNGNSLETQDGHLSPFQVVVAKAFRLPDMCRGCSINNTILWGIIFVTFSLVLIFIFLTKKLRKGK